MDNIMVIQEIMSGSFGIDNIKDYLDYATEEIKTSEKVLSQLQQLDGDVLLNINDTVKEIENKIKICKQLLYWYNVLPHRKIQERYNVYQRKKPNNSNEIREIDLNYESDIAYLNCIVKRDIRKSGVCGFLEDEILTTNAGQVKMRINENYPNCIEVYNPSIKKGLIWEPKTKRILQFI